MKPGQSDFKRTFRVLDEDEDDPMLSIINLVDVFLVAIGILLIGAAQQASLTANADSVTIVRNAGKPNMEIVIKDGEKISKFQSSGISADGDGERVGTAYRLQDGTMVYVPAATAPSNREQLP